MNSVLAPDEHEQRQASSGATLSPTERMRQNQAKSGGPQAGGPSPQPLVVPTSAGSRPALLFGSCSAILPDSQSGAAPASEGTSVVNTIIDEHTDPECMRNGKVSLPSTLKVYIIPTTSRRDKRRTAAVPIDASMELPAHCGGITRMVLSHRDEHLFTISEDGALMVFQIWLPSMASIDASTGVPGSPVRLSPLSAARTAVTDGSPRKGDPKQPSLPTSEETLVTRAYLDKRERIIIELERQVAELGDQIEYQLRLRDEKHREKADKLEEKYSETMAKEMRSYGQLKDDKDVMVAGFEEELVQLADTHLTNLDQLEKTFDHKMDLETQRALLRQEDTSELAGDGVPLLGDIAEPLKKPLAELTECSEKEFQEWIAMKETIEAKHERIVEAMGRVFGEERKKNREEREVVLEDKEKDFREHHQKL
ncbi:WD repeat domain 65, partial [Perkinsus olseni]